MRYLLPSEPSNDSQGILKVKFCQRGSNSDNVFFFVVFFFSFFSSWRENGSKVPLRAGHHRPTSETPLNGVSLACRWWPNIEFWLGSFVIFQGIWASIAKKPIFLWFFTGVSGPHAPPPPLDPPMTLQIIWGDNRHQQELEKHISRYSVRV